MNESTHSFKIEERRKKVTSLLAQSMNESEIAQELGVNQSTISRDVKALKKLSRQFVYDLAKSDLAFAYKQCIEGIEEVKAKAWSMFRASSLSSSAPSSSLTNPRDKLLALKLIKECDESMFTLFSQGPSVMNIKALEERINKIESSARQVNQ